MTEGIIIAVLSMVGTLAGAYLANRKSSALIAYRLEKLEEKVDKFDRAFQAQCIAERNYEKLEMYVMELLMGAC